MKNKVLKRVLAWVVIAALIGTMIISVLVSAMSSGSYYDYDHDHEHEHAEAESSTDSYSFDIEFMEEEQALRVTQRLVFYTTTG